ncbi:MAG: tRNA preQ1(34) S-adenosylmethionine ribosyltransferase-isomerase QueA, partial [Chrysiogenales bacterium]
MKLTDFDFVLPAERIARFPTDRRDESRLLVLDRKSGKITHATFKQLPDVLAADDFLVMNNSRVRPARLLGRIGGKAVEMLVVRNLGDKKVEVLCQPAKYFNLGAIFCGADGLEAEVLETGRRGRRLLLCNREYEQVLAQGYAPLPPYIKRKSAEAINYRSFDLERYQTIYARNAGSIAAPTAGLHFTPEVLARIRSSNPLLEITLEVGEATFQKIEAEDISRHRMGSEKIRIAAEVAHRILALKEQDKKLLAVGTTSVRALESYALLSEPCQEFDSDIFISPGFHFRMVDKLLTNFHLPRSSLFILAAAFAGQDLLQETYRQAIAQGYRFFSYGDAMLIV